MKILASRRDEILKERTKWQAERDAAYALRDQEDAEFNKAEYAITGPIKEDIEHMLQSYRSLTFDVSVERDFGSILTVRVSCNENNKFSDDTALSWSYKAALSSDGEVIKETNSWSGLKAVTESQMQSLAETLEALKYLNSIDWKVLLNKTLPNYKDYRKTDTSKYTGSNAPNFDRMLLEADIEDAISKPTLLKGGNSLNSHGYPIGESYYMILRETPSQYEVIQIPGYEISDNILDDKDALKSIVEQYKPFSYRLRKDNLIRLLNKPIEYLEV